MFYSAKTKKLIIKILLEFKMQLRNTLICWSNGTPISAFDLKHFRSYFNYFDIFTKLLGLALSESMFRAAFKWLYFDLLARADITYWE